MSNGGLCQNSKTGIHIAASRVQTTFFASYVSFERRKKRSQRASISQNRPKTVPFRHFKWNDLSIAHAWLRPKPQHFKWNGLTLVIKRLTTIKLSHFTRDKHSTIKMGQFRPPNLLQIHALSRQIVPLNSTDPTSDTTSDMDRVVMIFKEPETPIQCNRRCVVCPDFYL